MGKKKSKAERRLFNNQNIVLIKVTTALILFFCCSFFFIQNRKMFLADLKSWMFLFPILFFAGIFFICIYIAFLVGSLEKNELVHSDRYDILYRIIFTITFLLLTVRSFLGDFMHVLSEYGTNLNVPIPLIILAILSGIVTWITPKIKDNDNKDF